MFQVPSMGTISIVKYDLLLMMTLPGIVALLAWETTGVKIFPSFMVFIY